MGRTAEGQDNGNPTNKYDGGGSPDPNAAVTKDLPFSSIGRTEGALPKSKGLHPAQFALGHGIPD